MTGQPHDMYAIFDTLLERGVLSPEALIAAPELHDALQAALYRHALRIASAEENKKHLAAHDRRRCGQRDVDPLLFRRR